MKRNQLAFIALLVLGLCGNLKAQPADLDKNFLHAKQLIEANCGDCIGGTREGLEEGIAELVTVIRAGYKNEFEAYRLLAKAYNEMAAVYAVPDSAAQKDIIAEYRKTLKKLLQLAPNDSNILYDYALSLDDKDLQIEAYRKVLGIDPNNFHARFALGALLVDKGQLDAGIQEVKESLKLAKGKDFENYGRRAIQILEKNGRTKDAEELRSRLEQETRHERIYTQGINEMRFGDVDKGIKLVYESVDGDVTRLPEWEKKRFAEELEQKRRYKESADMLKLADPEKYREKIKQLHEKAAERRK